MFGDKKKLSESTRKQNIPIFDLFMYSYKADFTNKFIKDKQNANAKAVNLSSDILMML